MKGGTYAVAVSWVYNIVGPFRATLYTLAAAVGLLLLIACSNVANMLLARAAGRENEMAIRASMGASRARLIRQLLVESLLLAAGGVVAGCVFSYVGIQALIGLIPDGLIPREANITVVGLAAGYFPARRATRVEPLIALRG